MLHFILPQRPREVWCISMQPFGFWMPPSPASRCQYTWTLIICGCSCYASLFFNTWSWSIDYVLLLDIKSCVPIYWLASQIRLVPPITFHRWCRAVFGDHECWSLWACDFGYGQGLQWTIQLAYCMEVFCFYHHSGGCNVTPTEL